MDKVGGRGRGAREAGDGCGGADDRIDNPTISSTTAPFDPLRRGGGRAIPLFQFNWPMRRPGKHVISSLSTNQGPAPVPHHVRPAMMYGAIICGITKPRGAIKNDLRTI